jgi:hypothetical protein
VRSVRGGGTSPSATLPPPKIPHELASQWTRTTRVRPTELWHGLLRSAHLREKSFGPTRYTHLAFYISVSCNRLHITGIHLSRETFTPWMYVTNRSKGHDQLSTLPGALPAVRYISKPDDAVNGYPKGQVSQVSAHTIPWDLRFSQRSLWTLLSCGMWRRTGSYQFFGGRCCLYLQGCKNKIFLLRIIQKTSTALQRPTPTRIRKMLL